VLAVVVRAEKDTDATTLVALVVVDEFIIHCTCR
jgi:hypothetical protein